MLNELAYASVVWDDVDAALWTRFFS